MATRERAPARSFRLRTQLLLYSIVVSVCVLAAGALASYAVNVKVLTAQNEQYFRQQFLQADSTISSLMADIDRLSRVFTSDQDVRMFIDGWSAARPYEAMDLQLDVFSQMTAILNYYGYLDSIYLFTDDGGQIGESLQNAIVSRSPAGAAAPLLEQARARSPQAAWGGGMRESDFNPHVLYRTGARDARLVSLARRIVAANGRLPARTIVFNVREREIASLYSLSDGSAQGRAFIVDGTGRVISSGAETEIGSLSPVGGRMDADAHYASFLSSRGGKTVQTIYYRLAYPGWTLVREMSLEQYSRGITAFRTSLVCIFLASIIAIFALSLYWLSRVTRPLHAVAQGMKDLGAGNLGVTMPEVPRDEVGFLVEGFNEMSRNIATLVRKNDLMQEEKRELEIEALQAQINPHFIYNTLNMVKWMASMAGARTIVDCIVALSSILGPVFRDRRTTFTLREELEYLTQYIRIMNWRFGSGVTLENGVPQALQDRRIPRFILQPLVENAILHGMRRPENAVAIRVAAGELGDRLVVSVEDDGTGITDGELARLNAALSRGSPTAGADDSIGILNVNRRIVLTYGASYGLRLEGPERGGTRAVVTVPRDVASTQER